MLYLDYNLIEKNITTNYKLAKYLKEKERILDLIALNDKAILFAEGRYIKEDYLLNQMKKSNFISLVFLGKYGSDNDLYRYSEFYIKNKDINNLLYEQLKTELTNDVLQYINASNIIKNNEKINELVLLIEPKMNAYMNK